jgi:TonB-dependent SusC/RagA subfamily outer membrane receptor
MKKTLLIYLLFLSGLAYGQKQQIYIQNLKTSDQDLFQKNLYSADRVMEMRKELKLTEDQATKIKKVHSENAGKFSAMKWDLDDASLKLKELLDQSKVDEIAVQKQMDKVLALENSLKKQQLSTMVTIKNELTEEQQEILAGQRVFTLNGVDISGYGKTQGSSEGTLMGYPSTRYRVGQPLVGTALSGTTSSNSKIVVQSTYTSQEDGPLYMLDTKDGMKELKDLKKLNPNDIESINVIKDAAAINTYGEKGKNGVIVIKLKEDPKK